MTHTTPEGSYQTSHTANFVTGVTHTTPEVEEIDVSTYAESFHSRLANVWGHKEATRNEIELTLESIITTLTTKHQEELKSKEDEWYEVGYREGRLSRENDMNTLKELHQEELESLKIDLLSRMQHEDYVSCPTCDETLHHLQALAPTKTDKQ